MEHTVDGKPVKVGMRVFTNNCKWGTVASEPEEDGWFQVLEDGSTRTTTLNGERVHTKNLITNTNKTDPNPVS